MSGSGSGEGRTFDEVEGVPMIGAVNRITELESALVAEREAREKRLSDNQEAWAIVTALLISARNGARKSTTSGAIAREILEALDASLSAVPAQKEETCPTCGGTGPDSVDRDFDSGMLEAECGDEWHDRFIPAPQPEEEKDG